MMQQILYGFLLILGFGGIIVFVEFLHHRFLIEREYTRKIAHSLAAFGSLIFLLNIFSSWLILAVALFFSVLLAIGKKKDYFKSIDSIHDRSAGSIILPISLISVYFIAEYFHNSLLFILPVLIVAICDPLAWLAGTYFKHRTKRIVIHGHLLSKTIIGSAVFFISAWIVCLITLAVFGHSFFIIIFFSLLVSGIDTVVEMISPFGTDNLFLTIVTAGLLILLS
jgi:dolichol kinase